MIMLYVAVYSFVHSDSSCNVPFMEGMFVKIEVIMFLLTTLTKCYKDHYSRGFKTLQELH